VETLKDSNIPASHVVQDGQSLGREAYRPRSVRPGHILLDRDPVLDTDAVRLAYLDQAVNDAVSQNMPQGLIFIWSGLSTETPAGYGLCDGQWYDPDDDTVGQVGQASSDATHTIQTPDMCDKFLVGAGGYYGIGNTGGEATHALTIAELAAHNHTVGVTLYKADGTNSIPRAGDQEASTMQKTYTSSEVGSGSAHENRPPYYAVAYLMKLTTDTSFFETLHHTRHENGGDDEITIEGLDGNSAQLVVHRLSGDHDGRYITLVEALNTFLNNPLAADLDANSKRIYNLPTPAADTDAATKYYVDNATPDLSGTYLKLDGSNDPMTGDLDIGTDNIINFPSASMTTTPRVSLEAGYRDEMYWA